MRRWLSLVIKLCILKLCFCEEKRCWRCPFLDDLNSSYMAFGNKIVLQPEILNNDMVQIYDTFWREITQLNCEDMFQSIDHTKEYENEPYWSETTPIIYLSVEDFYKTNYIKNNFMFAGNITTYNKTIEVFTSENINSNIINNITVYKYVKLVNNILSQLYPTLHEFVNDFSRQDVSLFDTYCDKPTVIIYGEYIDMDLLCRNSYICDALTIKNVVYPDEIDSQERVLAISSGTNLSETQTPTIFYNQIELPEEIRNFHSNCLPGIRPEQINYAFVEFLKAMGWKRVAIISDDSEESVAFERSLTPLLEDNSIVYITKICEGVNCNFRKALKSLVTPRIVIANVKEKYAEILSQQWAEDQATKKHRSGIVWVARGWSNVVATRAATILTEDTLYSLTFAPSINYHDQPDIDESIYIQKLIRPLSVIVNQVASINYHELKQSEIAAKIKENLHSEDIKAYVIHTSPQGVRNLIATMDINLYDSKVTETSLLVNPKISSSVPNPQCFFIANVYDERCNDLQFILLMLVFCVFFMVLMIIICFFEESDRTYVRMEC